MQDARATRLEPAHWSRAAREIPGRTIRRSLRSGLNVAVAIALAGWLGGGAPALAAAGGGSADFGGDGGGGGGGGFVGDGSGSGGGAALWIVGGIVVLLIVLRCTVAIRALHRRRRVRSRERQIRAGVAIAAQDDPAFAAERVQLRASRLWLDIQAAWDAGDRNRLKELVGSELWGEWDRRLAELERKGWRNRVEPMGLPKVEYVGLHRGRDPADGRVVVSVEARVRDYVVTASGGRITRKGTSSDIVDTLQYWTLARRGECRGVDERWILVSIEEAGEGEHHLTDAIIAAPEYDVGKIRDEALTEGALAEAAPPGINIAELTDLEFVGDARQAANDVSLVDARFDPEILEVTARRAVDAWAQAIDGDHRDLERISDRGIIDELLYPEGPSGNTRVVVRGPHVRKIRIVSLDPKPDPPAMRLEIELEGWRYVEDRDTRAVLSGSRVQRARFTERWTMALCDDDQPWRIVSAATHAET